MPPGLVVFLGLMAVAVLAWALLRSRWYREALEDLEGLRKAPEAHMKPSGLHTANPIGQLMEDEGGRRDR